MNLLKEKLLDVKYALNAQHVELVHVVAFDRQHCIGKNNQLAWHVPEDLQHFKAITSGGVIVMGRKTLESMGRTLPNRSHWVLTRDTSWQYDGVQCVHDLADALYRAGQDALARGQSSVFVIGGGEIFAQTLPIMDRLEISRIDLDVQGDAFYPAIPPEFVLCEQEQGISAKNGVGYVFETYRQLHNADKIE